ncbi:MAG: sulfatase-like hydrolase/transferase, partial [Bacteroidales bacterium]
MHFKTFSFFTFCLSAASVTGTASNQPNFVFVMTDQQSYNMMSCMGNEYLHTPAMDKLAREGFRFEKTYCVNPVSVPSRFSLMTGRYASELGVKANSSKFDREKLSSITPNALGNVFSNAGYETVYAGKTHLYTNDADKDYGFNILTTDPYEGCADAAVSFFQDRKAAKNEKPFFLFLSFLNPHDICYDAGLDPRYPDKLKPEYIQATERFLAYKKTLSQEEYQRQIPPLVLNEAPIKTDMNDPELLPPSWLKETGSGYKKWTLEEKGLYRWMYCRLTESVDHLIGRSLKALDESGFAENTIIIFTSDHGELLGAHGLVSKSAMVEECQRVPFIFTGKGILKGRVDSSTLVCNGLDLLPTMCDLAGIDAPKGLHGVSLKPYITGEPVKQVREYIVTENFNGYQIHDGRHK